MTADGCRYLAHLGFLLRVPDCILCESRCRPLPVFGRRDAVRIILFGVTALVTATVVSMVGSIGFVGLIVPHAARFVVGPSHIRLLPTCVVVGAIFMVLADIISRIILPQQVLPIGVVTALIGVPFFSIILYRTQRTV